MDHKTCACKNVQRPLALLQIVTGRNGQTWASTALDSGGHHKKSLRWMSDAAQIRSAASPTLHVLSTFPLTRRSPTRTSGRGPADRLEPIHTHRTNQGPSPQQHLPSTFPLDELTCHDQRSGSCRSAFSRFTPTARISCSTCSSSLDVWASSKEGQSIDPAAAAPASDAPAPAAAAAAIPVAPVAAPAASVAAGVACPASWAGGRRVGSCAEAAARKPSSRRASEGRTLTRPAHTSAATKDSTAASASHMCGGAGCGSCCCGGGGCCPCRWPPVLCPRLPVSRRPMRALTST